MDDTFSLKDGTLISKGDLIQVTCRSYRFVEQLDGTSICIVDGEDGVYMFLKNMPEKNGILVGEKEGAGTYFVWTGPDRVSKYGLHIRCPEITLPRKKTIKPAKGKPKPINLPPSVIGSKVQSEKPKRGRKLGSKNKPK